MSQLIILITKIKHFTFSRAVLEDIDLVKGFLPRTNQTSHRKYLGRQAVNRYPAGKYFIRWGIATWSWCFYHNDTIVTNDPSFKCHSTLSEIEVLMFQIPLLFNQTYTTRLQLVWADNVHRLPLYYITLPRIMLVYYLTTHFPLWTL